MSIPINPHSLASLQKTKQEYSSSESIYLKLPAGLHQLRICPPWSQEGSVCRMIVSHSNYKNKDGNLRMPLCYRYCFTEENIALELKKRNVIKPEDLKYYGQFGCVYCRISDAKKAMEGKKANTTFARSAYFWNVINRTDGKVYVFRTGSGLLDAVTMMYGMYNKFFDINEGFDIMVNAVGEKLQRRYTYNPISNPTKLGVELDKLHDLDNVMADGYTNLSEALELIVASYPQMVQLLSLNTMAVPQGV
jgi:hypothetical protein